MKTLQIKHQDIDGWLLKKLFKDYLKDDSLWHFVYWKDFWTHKAFIDGKNIILRISDATVLKRVKTFLDKTPELTYEEYDFPYTKGKFQLGIQRKNWEARNLEYCLPMLHALSIARLHFGPRKRFARFISHYLHIAFNMAGYGHGEEATFIAWRNYCTVNLLARMYKDKNNAWRK